MTVVKGREALADELERWFVGGKTLGINVQKDPVWEADSRVVVKPYSSIDEFNQTLLSEELGAKVHLTVALVEESIDQLVAFTNLRGKSCFNVDYHELDQLKTIQLDRKMLETLASLHHGRDDWVLTHGDAHPRNFVIPGFLTKSPVIDESLSVVLVDLESSKKFCPKEFALGGNVSPLRDLLRLLSELQRTSGLLPSTLMGIVEEAYLPNASDSLRDLGILDKLRATSEVRSPKLSACTAWELD